MARSRKQPYDAVFRFRGFSDLGLRIARILQHRRDDTDADIMREGVVKYVAALEHELGLPPPVVAERPSEKRGALARKKVSYSKKRKK